MAPNKALQIGTLCMMNLIELMHAHTYTSISAMINYSLSCIS